jgi:hypothetical protein
MSEQPIQETQKPFDNKTLTIAATALVACSNLLPTDMSRKIGAAAAPCVTIAIAYVFQKVKNILYMYIEQRRGIGAYSEIISDLNTKLVACQNVREQGVLKRDISKYEKDLQELKIKNIKSFI